WQCAGAAAVFRSGQPSSGRDHYCGTGIRWVLGSVGCFLCYPAGDADQGGVLVLAQTGAAGQYGRVVGSGGRLRGRPVRRPETAARGQVSLVRSYSLDSAASRTSSTWPLTRTLRHSLRRTPFESIRKVLRSPPGICFPYMLMGWMTSNIRHRSASVSEIS